MGTKIILLKVLKVLKVAWFLAVFFVAKRLDFFNHEEFISNPAQACMAVAGLCAISIWLLECLESQIRYRIETEELKKVESSTTTADGSDETPLSAIREESDEK